MSVDPATIIGIVGRSGSGKTTLLSNLIPLLVARGYGVSTVKHTHHDFDMDQPGKDSYRHREAGAHEVLLASGRRWALLHELRDQTEPSLDDLLARMAPVDIVLVEGFKSHRFPKIEVHRPAAGHPLMAPGDDSIVAVAADVVLNGLKVPLLDVNRAESVADFIVRYLKD